MFGELLDTSPAQRDANYAPLRALTVLERAALPTRLGRGARNVAEAGISAPEIRRELAVRMYGEDVAMRLWGPGNSSAP